VSRSVLAKLDTIDTMDSTVALNIDQDDTTVTRRVKSNYKTKSENIRDQAVEDREHIRIKHSIRRSPSQNVQIIKINQASDPNTSNIRSVSKVVLNSETKQTDIIECEPAVNCLNVTTWSVGSVQNKVIKNSKSDVFNIEKKDFESIEGKLDNVKTEIVRIISEKDCFYKENGTLKNYKQACEILKQENLKLKTELLLLKEENTFLKSPNTTQDIIVHDILDRSPPDGQEIEADITRHNIIEVQKNVESNIKNEANKQIRLLEESVFLMRSEFGKIDFYWMNKLNNERNYFEISIKESQKIVKELTLQLNTFQNINDILDIKINNCMEDMKELKTKFHLMEQNHLEMENIINHFDISKLYQISKDSVFNNKVNLESFSYEKRVTNSENIDTKIRQILPRLHQELVKSVIREIVWIKLLESIF